MSEANDFPAKRRGPAMCSNVKLTSLDNAICLKFICGGFNRKHVTEESIRKTQIKILSKPSINRIKLQEKNVLSARDRNYWEGLI